MSLAISAICIGLAVFLYWKLKNMDQDPNIPGPISHVILPAAGLPVILILVVVGLLMFAYRILG